VYVALIGVAMIGVDMAEWRTIMSGGEEVMFHSTAE
jgi:hypothetical protein